MRRDFQEWNDQNCERLWRSNKKRQNVSFKFDNKSPHLTIAGAVSVGGMERSLQQIEE